MSKEKIAQRFAQRDERYKAKVKELKKQKKWKPEHDQRAQELGLDKLLKEEED